MRSRCELLGAILVCLSTCGSAAAQDDPPAPDPRIDPITGRQNAVWPTPRRFDFLHMRLELAFPDMQEARLEGVQTLRLTPVGRARAFLELDCRGPQVGSVLFNGAPAAFTLGQGTLRVEFPAPLPPGQEATVTIAYTLDFSENRGEGLTWARPRPDAESESRRFPMVHAQGQAQLNSMWFPCHDFPNERLTTEILVDVEDGYDVVSNGRLVSREASASGRVRWHWSQEQPHVNYLVTLAIGKWHVRDVGGSESARPGLAMPVYVDHRDADNIEPIFGATPAMVAFFETLFAEPYPWHQYAQVCVRQFAAGGMENTGCTLLTDTTSRGSRPGSRDDLIAHELAHQWTGDLLTCNSWEHLWLNEGWASYAECLWEEHKAGDDPAEAKRAYLRAVVGYVRQQRSQNRGRAPEQPPMASNRYENPDDVFGKADDVYSKGAVVLHMLRMKIGDAAFFAGVRAYIQRHKFGTVETSDFRRALERASGKSLEQFFDQWVYRPGLPALAADYAWDGASSTLKIMLEQTQVIDRLNPAYRLDLPVRITYEDGTIQWVRMPLAEASAERTFTLAGRPRQVSIDPEITQACRLTIRTPLETQDGG
ncbi:MAG: M1 family metallopeptidase [Planctomycetota bacterium]|nr:M1 family metallopeptidase [Planctomycetota bacterium]